MQDIWKDSTQKQAVAYAAGQFDTAKEVSLSELTPAETVLSSDLTAKQFYVLSKVRQALLSHFAINLKSTRCKRRRETSAHWSVTHAPPLALMRSLAGLLILVCRKHRRNPVWRGFVSQAPFPKVNGCPFLDCYKRQQRPKAEIIQCYERQQPPGSDCLHAHPLQLLILFVARKCSLDRIRGDSVHKGLKLKDITRTTRKWQSSACDCCGSDATPFFDENPSTLCRSSQVRCAYTKGISETGSRT